MAQSQPNISFFRSGWDSTSGMHRFSHNAMATTFEVIIVDADARYARQAAWAAFDELDRLEAELSRFIENSDISRINNLAANQFLQIGLASFECLQLSVRMYNQTNGAFDITLGSGIDHLGLDNSRYTVRLTGPVQIDLGGIGKGYALDKMAELLREWSIDTALIHGGGSTVLAIGAPVETRPRHGWPPRTKGWPLTLSSPDNHERILARLHLKDRAVSGSGLQKGRHIIDPRTTRPVEGKHAAWACASDAATADALSTAFMVMSADEVKQYCLSHPDVLAMIVLKGSSGKTQKDKILRFGPWKKSDLLKE